MSVLGYERASKECFAKASGLYVVCDKEKERGGESERLTENGCRIDK